MRRDPKHFPDAAEWARISNLLNERAARERAAESMAPDVPSRPMTPAEAAHESEGRGLSSFEPHRDSVAQIAGNLSDKKGYGKPNPVLALRPHTPVAEKSQRRVQGLGMDPWREEEK